MCNRIWLLVIAWSIAAHAGDGPTGASLTATVSAALADPHRPPAQRAQDARRLPDRLISFAGMKPGDQVADFMPGNGYFTRIFSRLLGPNGRVYAFIPVEQIEHCDASEIAGSRTLEHEPFYGNVVPLSAPVNQFSVPRPLDIIFTAQNYHDLHDRFLGPADIARVNRSFFNALKPGGVLVILDHAAESGSGLRDTEGLHRIDPAEVRREVEAAGFVYESQFGDLRNAADDHSRSVFDPVIRGRTDQFAFKFRRPDKPPH